MCKLEITLTGYAMKILSEREVSEGYAATLMAHCRKYCRWSARSVHVEDICHQDVNVWLAWLLNQGLRPPTVDSYRRHLLTVWRDAYDAGANHNPPLRVRRPKIPKQVVRAYTHEEIVKLLRAASKLKGCHRNGNQRADFWQALIHAAYSTALRRSDLLLIFRDQIDSRGVVRIIQSKTGEEHAVKLSGEALAFAARLTSPNGLLLPWPYRRDALVPRFRSLRKLAGVNRGSLKWLRRSSASYADRDAPGAGPKILGHKSPHVFKASYEDRSITGEKPPEPPELPKAC